jgi:hypothetical protein
MRLGWTYDEWYASVGGLLDKLSEKGIARLRAALELPPDKEITSKTEDEILEAYIDMIEPDLPEGQGYIFVYDDPDGYSEGFRILRVGATKLMG